MAALAVGMPSPWLHGLFADMHMAVEASDKLGWRYAGVQPEGLAPRAYAAMRVSWGVGLGLHPAYTYSHSGLDWPPVWVLGFCRKRWEEGRSGKGFRWLSSTNTNTSGTKPVKSAEGL